MWPQSDSSSAVFTLAMVWYRGFQEPRKGFVAHTAASRKLVEDPLARADLGYIFDEVWQSFAQVCNSDKATP